MKIKKSTRIVASFFAAFMIVGSFAGVARAESGESIVMSPTDKSYKADAGETISDSFVVFNNGSTAYDFNVYSAPYSVQDITYDANFTAKPANADVYLWVSFAQSTWHIEPGQTLHVPFDMKINKNAAPGGHYGAIFAETQPGSDGSGGVSLVRKKRVGMIIRTTVNGNTIETGSTKSIALDWFQSHAPLHATANLQNTGNVDFKATVTYEVKDIFDQSKYRVTNDYVVLPNTTRAVQLDWKDSSWIGLYKVQVITETLGVPKKQESYVLVAPYWFVWTVAGVAGSGIFVASRRKVAKK